jgi:hypothetical protein
VSYKLVPNARLHFVVKIFLCHVCDLNFAANFSPNIIHEVERFIVYGRKCIRSGLQLLVVHGALGYVVFNSRKVCLFGFLVILHLLGFRRLGPFFALA